MARPTKSFGKKNAPVLHAPGGLPNAAPPPPRRKMSMTVGLVSLGATALAGGAWLEARHLRTQAQECRAQAAQRGLPPENCPTSGGSSSSSRGGGGGHAWFSSSGSGSSHSTSDRGGSKSAPHGTFGGFGHAGAAHSGGHGGGA